MTGRFSLIRRGLWLMVAMILCLLAIARGSAEPEPVPAEFFFRENYINNADENFILLTKLKQIIEERKDIADREKALNDIQRALQAELEARSRAGIPPNDFSAEELPPPNAIVTQPQHNGKRTSISYRTLCHFKICNMGRKRQQLRK